jgi:hypothetical protein
MIDLDVVENSCGPNFLYKVDLISDSLVVVGVGDLHDSEFLHMVRSYGPVTSPMITSLIFIFYDAMANGRQNQVMGVERAQEQNAKASTTNGFLAQPTKAQMQNFISDDLPNEIFGSEPIAEGPLVDYHLLV